MLCAGCEQPYGEQPAALVQRREGEPGVPLCKGCAARLSARGILIEAPSEYWATRNLWILLKELGRFARRACVYYACWF